MTAAAGVFPPSPGRGHRLRLAGCLVMVAVPCVWHLPAWILVLAAVLLAWQIIAAWHDTPPPGRLVRFGLTAAAFSIVLAGFGHINGQQAGVALLLLMLVLKLCEIRNHRDVLVFLALAAFLLASQFLYSQSIVMGAYLVAATWLLVAAFVDAGAALTLAATLATSARLLVQALPVAALLFVLFPRAPGPLWGLPAASGARATTGLSDSMSPGSVARVARSNGVALRARFIGDVPSPRQRYWRGPVLWDFDHGTWRADNADRELAAATVSLAGHRARRTHITLEATHHNWLIALDVPLGTNHRARQGADATLTAAQDIDQRTRYTVRSAPEYTLDARLASATRRRATRLPSRGNPRARALADRWRARADTPGDIIADALALFRRQPFVYTLAPQQIGARDGIDAFLFSTRRGFCEHYAGAFTFLMRAAGLPARVVTGYQGGERALVGDYWIVRHSDAHAWSEVWLTHRGWVRIDPTAAVAPSRIETGVAAAVGDRDALPYMARSGHGAWYHASMAWDAVNTAWNRWFLAYGPGLQRRVLGALGLAGVTRMLVALTAGVVFTLMLISLWLAWRMRRAPHPDRVVRHWQRVCARLAAIGYPRAPHEGPRDYGERIAAARPELAGEIRGLAALYIRLRYAPAPQMAAEDRFARLAAAFRPSRRSRVK